MSLAQFKVLFSKFNKCVMQIAFGVGTLDANEDVFPIMEHTRSNGVIPNITVAGRDVTPRTAERLAAVVGACAVSRYNPRDVCYNAVKMLTDAGLVQTNIHCLVSAQSFQDCLELLDDAQHDPRLSRLNAIVFLTAKQKGRGTWLTPLPQEQYKQLIDTALSRGISVGFDSCGCHRFLEAVKDYPQYEQFKLYSEPCESGLFSAYVDVTGHYFPCSFSDEAVEGIDLSGIEDFTMDVWHSDTVKQWRKRLLGNGRRCPLFDV